MSIKKKLSKRFWQTGYLFQGFLEGDLFWGKFRILVLVGLVALFLLIVIITETLILSLVNHLSIFELPIVGASAPQTLTYLFTATLHSLRFILVPLAAFTIAMLVGAHYVQDIYELESYWVGMRYLLACIFGIGYPRLQIDNGRKMVKPDEVNTLATIGGPGYVMIRPGNAVLFEHFSHPSNVLAAGWHFISRFEFDQRDHRPKRPARVYRKSYSNVEGWHPGQCARRSLSLPTVGKPQGGRRDRPVSRKSLPILGPIGLQPGL